MIHEAILYFNEIIQTIHYKNLEKSLEKKISDLFSQRKIHTLLVDEVDYLHNRHSDFTAFRNTGFS